MNPFHLLLLVLLIAVPASGLLAPKPSPTFWKGKRVWITGASSGLGKSLAVELSKKGVAEVVLSARRVDKLKEVADECVAAQGGVKTRVLPLDLAKDAATVEAAAKSVGEIDVLFSNAGVGFRGDVAGTSHETHEMVMRTNFESAAVITRVVLPGMVARASDTSSCHLVAVSSVQAFFGQKMRSSYAASKHALRAFMDSTRAELGPKSNVKVTTVMPGYIKTGHSVAALNADGSTAGVADANSEKGEDPTKLANKILDGVATGKSEMLTAPLNARLAVVMRVLAPEFTFWFFAKKKE